MEKIEVRYGPTAIVLGTPGDDLAGEVSLVLLGAINLSGLNV